MASRKPTKAKSPGPQEETGNAEAIGKDSSFQETEDAIQAPDTIVLGDEYVSEGQSDGQANPASAPVLEKLAVKQEEAEHQPRFHFFIIDTGWKSEAAKVLGENFHMIREFQDNDPLYVLTHTQSVALVRKNPELIGRDPIILVHDLHAKGGRGESGYHGFRLCLGIINNGEKVLVALQKFLRFVKLHRDSKDIEKDVRKKLHRQGLEGAIEVIREGAELMLE